MSVRFATILALTSALVVPALTTPAMAEGAIEGAALRALRMVRDEPHLARSGRLTDEIVTGTVVKRGERRHVLYHLPALDRTLTLKGEADRIEWPFFVARQQLLGAVRLRLAYRNAVSVMPEASRLSVAVNGVDLVAHPIRSPGGSRLHEIVVPQHLLAPGWNALTVAARQRHRVDCSPQATHELWTRIDRAATGFVFERGNAVLDDFAALPAIARTADGSVRINAIVPPQADEGTVTRAMKLAARVAVLSGYTAPTVTVGHGPGYGPGLDLYAGPLGALERLAPDYAEAARGRVGPLVIARDGQERVGLVIADASGPVEALLPAAHAPVGTSAGLAALGRLHGHADKGHGPRALRLSDLGLTDETFDGRVWRATFDVDLPGDTFVADYGHVTFGIRARYAAGLAKGARFDIRVNGATAAGFALSKPGGASLRDRQLRLPLSTFRPGRNRVELVAHLPHEKDAACAPHDAIAGAERFAISAETSLTFPRLARLPRLPHLPSTLDSGFPYVQPPHSRTDGARAATVVAVPRPDADTLSAAATFVSRIATAGGRVPDLRLTFGAPPAGARNVVVVGTGGDLAGTVPDDIGGASLARVAARWGTSEYAPRTTVPEGDAILTASVNRPKSSPQPGFRFDASRPASELGLWDRAKALFWAREEAEIAPEMSDFVISQRRAPDGPANGEGVWTVLTARDPSSLRRGVEALGRAPLSAVERLAQTGRDVKLRVAPAARALDPDARADALVTASVAAPRYGRLSGLDPVNLRLVAAGWLSNNHWFYGVLMVMVLAALGALSHVTVRMCGVRTDKDDTGGEA